MDLTSFSELVFDINIQLVNIYLTLFNNRIIGVFGFIK